MNWIRNLLRNMADKQLREENASLKKALVCREDHGKTLRELQLKYRGLQISYEAAVRNLK